MTPVEEKDHQAASHEETIVPVKPGFSRIDPVAAAARREPGRSPRLLVGVALAAMLLLALAVIFVLPAWVADDESEQTAAVAPVEEEVLPEESAAPVLSAEEIAALRAEAEALLAELLTQQARLEELAAAGWGEDIWEQYQDRSRAGDDAYLANAFGEAVPAYSDALELGTQLLERSADLVAAAISAGNSALEAGNARLALEQFELALGIEADNTAAQNGRARAESLPQVLVLVQQGADFEREGELNEAAEAYREALGLDPQWQPARSALSSVTATIANQEFDALMSRGLSALAAEDYSDAYDLFAEALVLRPDSADARNAQVQAEQGQKLDEIALVEARALGFEARELWENAIQLYRGLLETDESLAFAQAGLQRSILRADLDAKLVNLIDNPALLFSDQVLADAGLLLDEAQQVENAGDRLTQQIADLDRLIVLASTPVTVKLTSDALTNVTVFRVGALGTFSDTEVELRPGNYRAQGTRNGYRDVLVDIIVRPGRDMTPIEVRCVEPI
jgi:tetratricopeptide (TPR) repeat protein